MGRESKKQERARLIAEESARRAQPKPAPALLEPARFGAHHEPSAIRRCATCGGASVVTAREITNGAASIYEHACTSCGAQGRTSNFGRVRVILFSAGAILIVSAAAFFTVPHALEFLPRGDTAEIATAAGALLIACLVAAGMVWAAPWEELRWARRNPIVGYAGQ